MDRRKYIPMFNIEDINLELFWKNVAITANINNCWEWQGYIAESGYGAIFINRENYNAHRISYYLFYKKDPKELFVCHKCDNKRCVNPYHLFEGTNKDNVIDMVKKGRWSMGNRSPHELKDYMKNHPEKINKGEKCHLSKLSNIDVIDIRNEYSLRTNNYSRIAKKYNVDKGTIRCIILNKTWKHLQPKKETA